MLATTTEGIGAMRRKRQHLTPLERRIIAVKYRDGEPVKITAADNHCARSTVTACAAYYGWAANRLGPRPGTTRTRRPKPPLLDIVQDIP